jgi:hypothetical protein
MLDDIAEGLINGLDAIQDFVERHPWLGWAAALVLTVMAVAR